MKKDESSENHAVRKSCSTKGRIITMKKTLILILTGIMTMTLMACGSGEKKEAGTTAEDGTTVEEQDASVSAVAMREQGNPLSIDLADIVEISEDGSCGAWVKLSTKFDPELSMFSTDTLAPETVALVVDFAVTDLDVEEATLMFQYQLVNGEMTYSVWDESSAADKLTITEDGKYRMVFDTKLTTDGALTEIDSFQLVFPCASETP